MSLEVAERTDAYRAREIRQRLRQPVNAVKDLPIRLNHPHGVDGIEWAILARIAREEVRLARKKALDDRIAAILAATKEAADRAASIQDWLFENPERVNKTPPNFYNEIKRRVSKAFDTSIKNIDCVRRQKRYIIPRHVAMYLAFETMNISLTEIGRRTGMRDHTTALSAIRRMPKPLVPYTTAEFDEMVEEWRVANVEVNDYLARKYRIWPGSTE